MTKDLFKRTWLAITLAAAAGMIHAQPPGPFSKFEGEPMTLGGGAQGISWGDANGDGWMDVFCAQRSSASSTLFLNKGDGTFVRASGTVGANLVNPIGATWGDAYNRGVFDLLISNNNGGNESLLLNDGEGTFTALKTGAIVSSGGNSNGGAWADYDRDGHLDVYITNSDGNNFLFRNNGDGTFTRIRTGPYVSGTGNSQGCTWVDYDNDGYPDLYVSRSQAANLLFHNQGNGGFSKVTNAPFATQTGLGFAWGDYDNDGHPDLFVANGNVTSLIHNDGGGAFTKVTSPIPVEPGYLQTVNWVDYDNDGWLDLFMTSTVAGSTCRLYKNNGDGAFTRQSGGDLLTATGRWFAAAWADINHDGFSDVLVSNINNPNVLYRNNGNSNHWLSVRLLGRVSNRSAVGAKVRVLATIAGRKFWQMRELATGGNTANQDQLDPIFGLGDAAGAETLRIEWPSGIVQEIHNIAGKQIAQKARHLRARAVLAAWLHRTTRYVSLKAIRARARRQQYELAAAQTHEVASPPQDPPNCWAEVAPLLDSALARLGAKDHEVLVLRYFENRTFPEIAAALGATEEGVRKRVNRAITKLRALLLGSGVLVQVSLLSEMMAHHAVEPCPAEVLAQLERAKLGGCVGMAKKAGWTATRRLWVQLSAGASVAALIAAAVLPFPARSTPLQTLQALKESTAAGDGQQWSQWVRVTTPEERDARETLSSNVVVQSELQQALVLQFGADAFRGSPFSRWLDDFAAVNVATATVIVSGDRAQVQLRNGPKLQFVQVNRQWQFDFFCSTPAMPAQIKRQVEDRIPKLRRFTSEVKAGRFENIAQAAAAFQRPAGP